MQLLKKCICPQFPSALCLSSLKVMSLVYGLPYWLEPPMEIGLRQGAKMGGKAEEEQPHAPFLIPAVGWYFPTFTVSIWALLYNNWEFKGAGKYCTDIWIFRKAEQKHMTSAITFTTNTLTEANTLVVKHKFNDQPCKDNYWFWFYREFDCFMKCTS